MKFFIGSPQFKHVQLVTSALGPVVILVATHIFSSALKERELQGKFVELAVGILAETPSAQNVHTRQWAMNVLDEYSGVPIGKDARTELTIQVIFDLERQKAESYRKGYEEAYRLYEELNQQYLELLERR